MIGRGGNELVPHARAQTGEARRGLMREEAHRGVVGGAPGEDPEGALVVDEVDREGVLQDFGAGMGDSRRGEELSLIRHSMKLISHVLFFSTVRLFVGFACGGTGPV